MCFHSMQYSAHTDIVGLVLQILSMEIYLESCHCQYQTIPCMNDPKNLIWTQSKLKQSLELPVFHYSCFVRTHQLVFESQLIFLLPAILWNPCTPQRDQITSHSWKIHEFLWIFPQHWCIWVEEVSHFTIKAEWRCSISIQ